jgi:hypothetical protein
MSINQEIELRDSIEVLKKIQKSLRDEIEDLYKIKNLKDHIESLSLISRKLQIINQKLIEEKDVLIFEKSKFNQDIKRIFDLEEKQLIIKISLDLKEK